MLSRNRLFSTGLLSVALAFLGGLSTGCNDVEPPEGGGGFVSDTPFGGPNSGEDGTSTGAGGDGGGDTSTSTDNASGDGEKAIVEADIIQVDGDKLYALSRYSGLSVVDMSDPSDLTILGRYPIQGVPFEMYLRDGIVYAMFSSFGRWECDEDYVSCEYISSSHIEALDIANPANIVQVGTFDLPGEISDSRIVGDVLYAVSYENGYCWGCSNAQKTTVTSIDVADPADIAVVDAVGFNSPDPYGYGWGRRSVTVTQDRMFIAGIEWDGNSDGHSTIQIVDISDPGGQLHVGATVEAAGMIESRWQMDEQDNVLRVISQPGVWWTNGVPQVQTFQIASSDSISPIATLNLVLPMPERLRSARFDGDRLYAITAEQTDPLFTIDLSDPAAPVQMGELEIPGWVYHLEPRGDRVFALGFDPANPQGSMNVSLFDVSNFSSPQLVKRVAFGGDWTWAPEDQDRIHKAFKIDETLGAIFVPYGAYDYISDDGSYGCAHMESGIQIIDFTQDSLTKRGSAPLHGFARRALIHEGNLFSVSDSEVSAYNIADRDAPVELDRVALSAWVNHSVRVGNNIVRVASDWWTSASTLDIVPDNAPDRAEPLGSIDLANAVSDGDSDCYGWGYFYDAGLFAIGQDRVALTWTSYDWSDAMNQVKTHVVVVNVSNPAEPAVEGKLSMPFGVDTWGWWGSLDGGKPIVQINNNLIFRHIEYDSASQIQHAWLEVVDLSDPAQPVHATSVMLPAGFGHSLLVKSGLQVLTSHWEPVAGMNGKVKFYLDRVTFLAGGLPLVSPKVNVPGALLTYDSTTAHALTVDFHRVTVPVVDPTDCYTNYGWDAYIEQQGAISMCSYVEETLKLVELGSGNQVSILDTEALDPRFYAYRTLATESRVFAQGYRYDEQTEQGSYTVLVLGDAGEDEIEHAFQDLPEQDYLWSQAAEGDYLVLSSYTDPGIHSLNASDLDYMTLEKKGEVTSWVYSVTLDEDRALCSLGPYGLNAVDLQ